jgi:NADPH:quinone reductase-like Zn-dependent oxidoreductase
MKAIQIKEYGAPEVLELVDLPKPVIKANEVMIKVNAAGVNSIDVKIRAGFLQKAMPFLLPKTLGWDAAGTITEVGANIKRVKVGDEVYSMTSFNAGGSYAEFMAALENEVALKPKNISFSEAASLPIIATTADTYLFILAEIKSGQKILIVGAAGGVGALAVQMAKQAGLHVVGIGSTKDLNYIGSLGADETLDYAKPDYINAVRDMDVVLDLAGGESQKTLYAAIKKGGILLSTVQPPDPEMAKSAGVDVRFAPTKADYTILNKVREMVEEGKLKLNVGKKFPLSQAVQAHRMMEKGSTGGKIILEID